MFLKSIQIRNFRNIESAELELGADFNYIIGDNGAGKTSLLEAISYIARGKSFKTANSNSLILDGKEMFEIVAYGNQNEILGLRRTKSDIHVRFNGQPLNRLSDLARHVPLLVITPSTHELIERGPDQRRQFIDWGVFHVEPGYTGQMQAYRKALKQRNATLRQGTVPASYWDGSVVDFGEKIDRARSRFIDELTPYFLDTVKSFAKINGVSLEYMPGWNRAKGLQQHLKEKLIIDSRSGNTSVGPHRADITIRIDDALARERLSRGQQKLVVISFVISQARLLGEHGLKPMILIDDLPSELDMTHQSTLLRLLHGIPSQKIITSIDDRITQFGDNPAVFHVEQGHVTPL
ncbi:MAG: DNA replication/repair protein RecF [Gammaproteobacteria bacterium]|jgi:DNA replication and repair protein RecF